MQQNISPVLCRKDEHLFYFYMAFSWVLGLYLFFSNPLIPSYFSIGSADWYLEYSRNIFHPTHYDRVMHFGESILLPLLAKLLRANQSLVAYKILCAFFTILIVPTLAYLASHYFNNLKKSFLLVLIFGFSFLLLRESGLGYPDPITILLFIILTFARTPIPIFCCMALAALSHFSLSFVGLFSLVTLFITAPNLDPKPRKNLIIFSIAGLAFGRILLQVWYWKFDYLHTIGRLTWATDRGLQFFIDKYLGDILGFWLIPGIPFLIVYFTITIYFFLTKRFWFALAILIAITLAYLVFWLTNDGLRDFAVELAGPYLFMLLIFLDDFTIKLKKIVKH